MGVIVKRLHAAPAHLVSMAPLPVLPLSPLALRLCHLQSLRANIFQLIRIYFILYRAITQSRPRAPEKGVMLSPTFKFVIAPCLLHVLLLGLLACGTEGDAPYKIGVMDSLTGPGETYGVMASQVKQMAADEINAGGGINGRMLELVVEDSQCSAEEAIAAYEKLTDVDDIKIILGTSCSGAMLGAAPHAEADGTILFSGLASNPDIANAGDYIFRTQMSDTQVGIDTGNLLWADGIRALATISEATDYAEGVRRTSVAQFEKRGGRVVAEERYDYIAFPWHMGSAYDTVYITAECLKRTEDDQDADGFRDCLYDITWSGAIGDNYRFDENGEVVGLSRVVVEVLPTAERTDDKIYRVLGSAPRE